MWSEGSPDLVGPDRETRQRAGTERVADRHIRRIASTRDEHAADPRNVVPRIKRMPAASDIGLEPRGKIHRTVRRRDADIAEIARAVASGNVHAAAECDRQMRVVAAHTFAFLESLPRRSRRSGILVAEGDVAMDVVADGLDAAGGRGGPCPQTPSQARPPAALPRGASPEGSRPRPRWALP